MVWKGKVSGEMSKSASSEFVKALARDCVFKGQGRDRVFLGHRPCSGSCPTTGSYPNLVLQSALRSPLGRLAPPLLSLSFFALLDAMRPCLPYNGRALNL